VHLFFSFSFLLSLLPDDSHAKEKSHPVGWLLLASGFTCVLDSPVPSQPPVAPAKQEHNNDENKEQTQRLAGSGDLSKKLMQIHLTIFLAGLPDIENPL
jgi:hypothetical protein